MAELSAHIATLDAGKLPPKLDLIVLFAPTGPIQEVSVSSGWGDEFLSLAERFDRAVRRAYVEPARRRPVHASGEAASEITSPCNGPSTRARLWRRAILIVLMPFVLPAVLLVVLLLLLAMIWNSAAYGVHWLRWNLFSVPIPSMCPPPAREFGVTTAMPSDQTAPDQ